MELLAVSVGQPRPALYNGKEIATGIWKAPVAGPVRVRRLNVDGDRQADLTVHGGVHKAVYAFPVEHYGFYQERFGPGPFGFGHFGENLTIRGLSEDEVRIGDRYRVGGALLEVSQPRSPCFKFGLRMGSREAIKACVESARTGFYLRVVEEGAVEAGDRIAAEHWDEAAPTVAEVHRLYFLDRSDLAGLRRAAGCAALAPAFRDEFIARLAALG
ncbi:MOSC domain-containing protein [Defluviimonas sp. WL0024]|uniref:MOSC domain-containing protein n=1 Tax=Albidovulum salinarum TaxID=2984153 RepID=A0ABT2X8D0_9RHOB|nr:MOSC domain-containing protein [Defluviimonas sp. WL0024]MCU9850201.1 MOSC domain-containing protein [Defluviimonas sp. WL0024]